MIVSKKGIKQVVAGAEMRIAKDTNEILERVVTKMVLLAAQNAKADKRKTLTIADFAAVEAKLV